MKCFVGLDFKSCKGTCTDYQQEKASKSVKVPELNNMAVCLSKLGKFNRAVQMLDKAIAIDEFHQKAHARKLTYHYDFGMKNQLRQLIKEIKATPSCYNKFVRTTMAKIDQLVQELNE